MPLLAGPLVLKLTMALSLSLRPVFASLIALLTATLANAAVYTDAGQLPDTAYDFVIVGGTSIPIICPGP